MMTAAAKNKTKAREGKKREGKLNQLSIRILPETHNEIAKMTELLGLPTDALTVRLLLEASIRIIKDENEKPILPPIMAASRGAMRNGLPELE